MHAMSGMRFVAWLLACALVAGAVGFQLGRRATPAHGQHDGVRAEAAATRRVPASQRPLPGPGTPAAYEADPTRLARDPAHVQRLLARYRNETETDRKGALLAILLGVGGPDVQRMGLELARSPDPAARRDGLALLAASSVEDTQVRALLVHNLQRERDPALLRQAVELLVPAPLPREDAAPMLDALAHLRAHDDAQVRAASVLQSAQWESTEAAEDLLHRALLDGQPEVREAAIAGVLSTAVRSERIKDALLAMASDPAAPQQQRSAAVSALHGFRLDRADHALYRQAVRALPADDPDI